MNKIVRSNSGKRRPRTLERIVAARKPPYRTAFEIDKELREGRRDARSRKQSG